MGVVFLPWKGSGKRKQRVNPLPMDFWNFEFCGCLLVSDDFLSCLQVFISLEWMCYGFLWISLGFWLVVNTFDTL